MYISNLVNKINRNRSRGRLKRGPNRKKNSVDYSLLYRISYAFVIVVILGGIMYFGRAIYSFNLERDTSDNRRLNNIDDSPRIAILLIGLDKTDEDNPFIDALSILTYDFKSKKIGILALNPDIEVYSPTHEKNIHLRGIYAIPEAYGEEVPFTINIVESLLALRIDRYVLMDTDGFQSVFSNFDPISVKVPNDIEDSDLSKFKSLTKSLSKGDSVVYSESFLSLIAADSNGTDEKLYLQSIFISNIIRSLFSFNNIVRSSALLDTIGTSFKSDLSTKELYQLLVGFRGMHKDQVKVAYTRLTSLSKKEDSFGIYPRYAPVLDGLDDDLSAILINNDILKEQAGIEVLNGSDIQGLATSRSRWITNSGGRIVHFGNSIEDSDKTYIYVLEAEKYHNTLTELGKIFNNKAIVLNEEYKYKHFGDIVVVLGTEYE